MPTALKYGTRGTLRACPGLNGITLPLPNQFVLLYSHYVVYEHKEKFSHCPRLFWNGSRSTITGVSLTTSCLPLASFSQQCHPGCQHISHFSYNFLSCHLPLLSYAIAALVIALCVAAITLGLCLCQLMHC